MEYRLIEIEYRIRIQYDEGPGSAMDVVSDETERRILMTGNTSDEASKEAIIARAQPFIPYQGPDYGQGEYEYYYRLEARKSGEKEWQYFASLYHPNED